MTSTTARLRDGKEITLRLIQDPPSDLIPQIHHLLHHKPSPYSSHFDDFFENSHEGIIEGLEWRFHLAFHEGVCIGNICTWEFQGIGILGHVYTHPDWRQLGLANHLLRFQEQDFARRTGHLMALNTGYQSMPYQIYLKHGYEGVPGAPGAMLKSENPGAWEEIYQAPTVQIAPLQWRHWPTANLLFLLEDPVLIRAAGIRIYGQGSVEGPFIFNRRQLWGLDADYRGQAWILETSGGNAAGWISLMWDPNWGYRDPHRVFDLFVHPNWRAEAHAFAATIDIPAGTRSYSTPEDPKNEVLEKLGLSLRGSIPSFFPGGQTLLVFQS